MNGLIKRVLSRKNSPETHLKYGPSQPGKPNVLCIAQPRSAGSYVSSTVQEWYGLNTETTAIAYGNFPASIFNWPHLCDFFEGGGHCMHIHTDGSKTNAEALKNLNAKFWLHFRDPRQSISSWVHYQTKYGSPRAASNHMPTPNEEWFRQSISDQVDWIIKHNYRFFVEYIVDWLSIVHTYELTPIVSDYNQFMNNRTEFFAKIGDYYSLPSNNDGVPFLPETETNNFRQGDPDEWKTYFTTAQQQTVTDLIPKELYARFGWQKN